MNADELDRILREFRKEHPPRQPKDRKGSRRRTGMDRLVDCIEEQLDALEDVAGTAPPVASEPAKRMPDDKATTQHPNHQLGPPSTQ